MAKKFELFITPKGQFWKYVNGVSLFGRHHVYNEGLETLAYSAKKLPNVFYPLKNESYLLADVFDCDVEMVRVKLSETWRKFGAFIALILDHSEKNFAVLVEMDSMNAAGSFNPSALAQYEELHKLAKAAKEEFEADYLASYQEGKAKFHFELNFTDGQLSSVDAWFEKEGGNKAESHLHLTMGSEELSWLKSTALVSGRHRGGNDAIFSLKAANVARFFVHGDYGGRVISYLYKRLERPEGCKITLDLPADPQRQMCSLIEVSWSEAIHAEISSPLAELFGEDALGEDCKISFRSPESRHDLARRSRRLFWS